MGSSQKNKGRLREQTALMRNGKPTPLLLRSFSLVDSARQRNAYGRFPHRVGIRYGERHSRSSPCACRVALGLLPFSTCPE